MQHLDKVNSKQILGRFLKIVTYLKRRKLSIPHFWKANEFLGFPYSLIVCNQRQILVMTIPCKLTQP